jgi:general secretion pathway protein E
MVDMGVEPYLVSATVLAILAQRLVRVVCEVCAEVYEPPPRALGEFEGAATDRPPRFRRKRGCDACGGTGYHGRTGLYELMPMTDDLRARVLAGVPVAEIRGVAEANGLVSLRAAGWAKACAGITTVEEVLRVTRDELL